MVLVVTCKSSTCSLHNGVIQGSNIRPLLRKSCIFYFVCATCYITEQVIIYLKNLLISKGVFQKSFSIVFAKTFKLLILLRGSAGRRSVAGEDEEEEQFSAVLMLMEILTNLLSKDFLSFASGLITSY